MKRLNLLNNIRVFPARTRRKVQAFRGSGEVRWIGENEARAYVPQEGSAYARTIRFHEAQHLNHSPRLGRPCNRDMYEVTQMGIEDAILHSWRCIWQAYNSGSGIPDSVLRDEKCTALMDLRDVRRSLLEFSQGKSKGKKINPDAWNSMCVALLRSASILERNGSNVRKLLCANVPRSLADVIMRALIYLTNIAGEGVRDNHDRIASELFESILMLPEDDPPECTNLQEPEGNSENDVPVRYNPTKKSEGDTEEPMPINKLKLDAPTACLRGPIVKRRSFGSNPDPFRLARASFSPMTNLFKIKAKGPKGGAFLFDASGSMGVTAERLASVAAKVPAATVAFYCHGGSHNGLTIFAYKGKRFSGASIEHGGGNHWDHQALQWLLKQKGPHYMVTDEQFCGGMANQAEKAASLLTRNLGKVTVFHSYDELEAELSEGGIK